jgi:hypothetical protein
VRNAGDPWWLATFPEQTERFHFDVQATPSEPSIDAVIGVSHGPATTWSQLAAIVRFSPAGVIDVRSGDTYRADVSYPYGANATYFIRMDIDVHAHTYSVTVTTDPRGGQYTTLASNYPFRTEQAAVTSLDAAAVYLEPSPAGSLQVCNLGAIADDTTADGCVTSAATSGFANAWMDPPGKAMVARFTATPSADAIDGVVGYSLDKADDYNDLAASIRFYTNGQIEARDGDVYRATTPKPYVAGHAYDFYVMLDLTTATYSIYVGEINDPAGFTLLANNFRFRPQQVGMPTITNLATVVDSPVGTVRVCQFRKTSPPNLTGAVPGTRPLAAFADGRVVASNATGSSIIDSDGRTIVTSPTTLSLVAIDSAGNIYDAAVTDTNWTTMTVRSFTSTLEPRWSHSYPVQTGPSALGDYGNGVLGIATDSNGTLIDVRTSDGEETSRTDLRAYQPMAIAIGPGRYAFAWRSGDDGVVEMHAVDGTKVWERRWTAKFGVNRLVMDRGGGLVFSGTFGDTGVDFGAGRFEALGSSEIPLDGYLVALQSDGTFRFAKRPYAGAAESLTADGSMIGYGVTLWSAGPPHLQLFAYDAQGGEHHTSYLELADDSMGFMRDVLAASDGRLLVNATIKTQPSAAESGFSGLFTLVY